MAVVQHCSGDAEENVETLVRVAGSWRTSEHVPPDYKCILLLGHQPV
jgi:hypothetical protein